MKHLSQEHIEWGRSYYKEAIELENAASPEQRKIDACWRLASGNFWRAFVLGHKDAPLCLAKCFNQGTGVPEDRTIAAYLFGVALELNDPKCATAKDMPPIQKHMKQAISKITQLFLDIHAKIIATGIGDDTMIKNMDLFEDTIALSTGKLISVCLFNDEADIIETIAEFKAEHSGWRYLGRGDIGEFADPVDEVGAAAAGLGGIHFDNH